MTSDEAKAAAILRETDPRTPAEQAALDAIARYRWVPVHANDWNLAIVRLLSIAGLLRDKTHEAHMAAVDAASAEATARDRKITTQHTNALDSLLTQTAARLDAGDDPADIATWVTESRAAISEAVDRAKTAHLKQPHEPSQNATA